MSNEMQTEMWDRIAGPSWVENATVYDEYLGPIGLAAMNTLEIRQSDHIVDIGCGTGETTLALAQRAPSGHITGVDISSTMIAAARQRVRQTEGARSEFLVADVQTHRFTPGEFDKAFSRMGVMFFSDPVVAFRNVASALIPHGRLVFTCFQDFAKNPALVLPMIASAEILEVTPPSDPSGPGPFSLADAAKTHAMLTQAGFSGIEMISGPDSVTITGAEDLPRLARQLLVQNPVIIKRFAQVDSSTQQGAIRAVEQALKPHCTGNTLQLDVATWIVSAQSSGLPQIETA